MRRSARCVDADDWYRSRSAASCSLELGEARIGGGAGELGRLTGSPTDGFRLCRRVNRPSKNVELSLDGDGGGSATGEPSPVGRGDNRGEGAKRGDEARLEPNGRRLTCESDRAL